MTSMSFHSMPLLYSISIFDGNPKNYGHVHDIAVFISVKYGQSIFTFPFSFSCQNERLKVNLSHDYLEFYTLKKQLILNELDIQFLLKINI